MDDQGPIKITAQGSFCAEKPARPCAVLVFGASGDLTRRKLISSLFSLYCDGLITENFFVLGCGRTKFSDSQFQQLAADSIENTRNDHEKQKQFITHFYYTTGNYDDPKLYEAIKQRLAELDEKYKTPPRRIFYLAVPPSIYGDIAEQLGNASLNQPRSNNADTDCPRLVVEKPFGTDLESANKLNNQLAKHFNESQIYRIDHYLGKETVQNILMFRFANAIFEPVWNRNYIDHVQITIAESLGVGHRGGYYDASGATRDMFQNHMLGMMALVAMEPPASFHADAVRDEKVKVLEAVRPINFDSWNHEFVTGQYTAGTIDSQPVRAYKEEQGVAKNSITETYLAARLLIDNWRWKDVPFYLRTGKRLPRKLTEIAIEFREVPHSMFAQAGIEKLPPNVLVMKIQPEEGIELSFQAKRPGSKVCMSTLTLDFSYAEIFGSQANPEAYQRLLLDCMNGDQTLFNRHDDVSVSWKLTDPIIENIKSQAPEPAIYPAGTQSFPLADALIGNDGRNWRPITQ
jgi:glucose-6-phosphate 1-dehydrogenase